MIVDELDVVVDTQMANLVAEAPVGLLLLDEAQKILTVNQQAQTILGGGHAKLENCQLSELLYHDCELFDLIDRLMSTQGKLIAGNILLAGPFVRALTTDVRASFDPALKHICLVLIPSAHKGPQDPSGLAMFAKMLGHEIKNPLGGISGAAQLMERNCKPDQAELLDLIRSESTRIGRLVDRFTSFEIYNAPRFMPINIHEVLDDIIQMQQISASGTIFSRSYDPSLPDVAVDRDHFHECVLNLIKNAVEAVEDQLDGRISVETRFRAGIHLPMPGNERASSSALLIRVSDNGIGIPHAAQDKVFNPFFTTKSSGSGVGLSVCQDIALAHGGQLSFTSRPGATEFDLILPIKRETNRH